MRTVPLSLVTIIAESVLKERLVDDLREAGAKGYTLTECEGEGARHRRVSEHLGANIRIEVIASPEVADQLLEKLTHDYFPRYAVIAYLSTVQVVRGEKYV
jgi:nitrogen regulatory protein P-II 2